MRRLLIACAVFLGLCAPGHALICSSVPYTFVNGTTADATQVNANFSAFLSCINTNAANSGANTSITSLLGLTSPPAGAGSLLFNGGTVTGSANAIVLAGPTPSGFTLIAGDRVQFFATQTNTGATTLAVNGTTATAITQGATPTALAGGEIQIGFNEVVYDGTQFRLVNPGVPSTAIMPFYASTCPAGWQIANGTNGTLDARGVYLRGYDASRGQNPNGNVAAGTYQADLVGPITVVSSVAYVYAITNQNGQSASSIGQVYTPNASLSQVYSSGGSVETRPRTVVVLYCEKL